MALDQHQPVVTGMLHQPAPGLHQPLLQTGQRPVLDPLRQHQSPLEVPQVVSDQAEQQPHSVGSECGLRPAAEPRLVGVWPRYFVLSVTGWARVPFQDRLRGPPTGSIGKLSTNLSKSSSVTSSPLPSSSTISVSNPFAQSVRLRVAFCKPSSGPNVRTTSR